MHVALLSYRSHPFVGGQGVYVRHLTRALADLGHEVTVFGGKPYPDLDDRVGFVALDSLDLYTDRFPWVFPNPLRFRSAVDVVEYLLFSTGSFAEPRTFSMRARRALRRRNGGFDVIHDVQCLGTGLLAMMRDGWPVVATFHHPIAIDRALELDAATTRRRRLQVRRWYGFTAMQHRVARAIPDLVTGSPTARDDIVRICGVDPSRLTLIPYGVDTRVFAPQRASAREPGRIITTTSSDQPLKGLGVLIEAVAKLAAERDVTLEIVGKPLPRSKIPALIDRFGVAARVEWVSGIGDAELARRYARASVAVVPSLYEGFSLPAVEALACGTPLVVTTAGALPWVVGDAAVLVPPADAEAMASAVRAVLDDPGRAAQLSLAGPRRVADRFTWEATAAATVEVYERAIARNAT